MPEHRVYFDKDLEPVNLAAPSRIVRGRLPAVDAIQDRLSRQLRLDLFQYLRYGVQIKQAQTNFEPHDELVRGFNSPVLVGIVSLAPLRGFSIIAVDGALVGAAVDRLCGGSEPGPDETRNDFSVFEQRIARRLLDVVQESLKSAWQGVADITVDLVRTEVNTSFIAIAEAQEPLITMRMNIEMATGGGEVVVAIPYPAIEPIRDKLSTAAALTEIRDEDKRYWRVQMRQALDQVTTEIRAELTRTSVPTHVAESLTRGQVLSVRIPPTARVYCGDAELFDADFGSREGAMALRVRQFNHSSIASEADYDSDATSERQQQDSEADQENPSPE